MIQYVTHTQKKGMHAPLHLAAQNGHVHTVKYYICWNICQWSWLITILPLILRSAKCVEECQCDLRVCDEHFLTQWSAHAIDLPMHVRTRAENSHPMNVGTQAFAYMITSLQSRRLNHTRPASIIIIIIIIMYRLASLWPASGMAYSCIAQTIYATMHGTTIP